MMDALKELLTRCKQISAVVPIKRLDVAEAELANLEAVVEAAREVEDLGWHSNTCNSFGEWMPECDCGFDAIMEALQALDEA